MKKTMTQTVGEQSAVEWYSDKLLEILGDNVNLFTKQQTLDNHYALKQAKEMEKQQITDAYDQDLYGGLSGHRKFENGEHYYNETYNVNK